MRKNLILAATVALLSMSTSFAQTGEDRISTKDIAAM